MQPIVSVASAAILQLRVKMRRTANASAVEPPTDVQAIPRASALIWTRRKVYETTVGPLAHVLGFSLRSLTPST